MIGFLAESRIGPKKKVLKHGEYMIKPHASIREIVDVLSEGKAVQYKVTIPEGLTSQQIVERLKAEENLDGRYRRGARRKASLFPETYGIEKGMTRAVLLERMKEKMQQFLATAWEKRKPGLLLKTPQEAVVFASIVEKETGRPDERDRVAAVFMNRLRKGMRLQSDPTVIYGIVGGQGPLGRSLTRADLDQKSSHNTYQIDGLPPTPICNPGRSAIEASLNPATTTDLYFVADGTGGHAFSDTLKEHNAAVSNWRKVEKERAKKEAATAPAAAIPAPPAAADAPAPDAAPAAKGTAPVPVPKPKKTTAKKQTPPGPMSRRPRAAAGKVSLTLLARAAAVRLRPALGARPAARTLPPEAPNEHQEHDGVCPHRRGHRQRLLALGAAQRERPRARPAPAAADGIGVARATSSRGGGAPPHARQRHRQPER